jgi:hypothetical protein
MAQQLTPGVPPLLNGPAPAPSGNLLTADSNNLAKRQAPKWGIYKNGSLVLTPDSVIGFEYKNDYLLSDYPQEAGAFQSYNKVASPYDAKMQMTKGGKDADRAAFLNALNTLLLSLDTYDIVTPEITYINANLKRYDYRRDSRNGFALLKVELWFEEIRITAASAFSNTAQPSGASAVNVGTVQPTAPTPAQAAPVKAAIAKTNAVRPGATAH